MGSLSTAKSNSLGTPHTAPPLGHDGGAGGGAAGGGSLRSISTQIAREAHASSAAYSMSSGERRAWRRRNWMCARVCARGVGWAQAVVEP